MFELFSSTRCSINPLLRVIFGYGFPGKFNLLGRDQGLLDCTRNISAVALVTVALATFGGYPRFHRFGHSGLQFSRTLAACTNSRKLLFGSY